MSDDGRRFCRQCPGKMMKRLYFVLPVLMLSATLAFGGFRAITPDPYGGNANAWQLMRHASILAKAKVGGAPVVFLGDSITHFWENAGKSVWEKYFAQGEMRALNLGTCGDCTEHVLWRIGPGGELDGYEVKCIVLMIGTNNAGQFSFAKEPPIDTIEGIRRILKTIAEKQPNARTILLPIFPRGGDETDAVRRRNNIVNGELFKFADGKRVIWCDFNERFLNAEGKLSRAIMPDALHPTRLGYEIWASAVIPVIRECLAATPDACIPSVWPSHAAYLPIFTTPWPASPVSAYGQAGGWDRGVVSDHRSAIADNGTNVFDIVWVGDDITQDWQREGRGLGLWVELRKTYNMLNLGIGGDRTEHVLWRLGNGELEGYRAKLFTVMVGTNNAGVDVPGVAESIRRIVELIRMKHLEAKVCLMPIFPRNASAKDRLRAANVQICEAVHKIADGQNVLWLDFNADYLKPDGELAQEAMGDWLHPNENSYYIWWNAIHPLVKSITGK